MNAFSLDFSNWKANGMGIDLNRQYPSGWAQLEKGPSVPWYQFYKGTHPLEAKEVQALTSFTNQIKPEVAISYHSSGREIFWKYNQKANLKKDRRLAKKVSSMTDYPLSTPEKSALGGGFTDWFITCHHKPGMTIEISYSVGETNPPLTVFPEEWKRNKFVGIMIATEMEKQIKSSKDK
jgi:g-D-glutamyl-meso-diaminopimelate peptidase